MNVVGFLSTENSWLLCILVPIDADKYRKGGSIPLQKMVEGIVRRLMIVGIA